MTRQQGQIRVIFTLAKLAHKSDVTVLFDATHQCISHPFSFLRLTSIDRFSFYYFVSFLLRTKFPPSTWYETAGSSDGFSLSLSPLLSLSLFGQIPFSRRMKKK